MPDFFPSYNREDQTAATLFADGFKRAGRGAGRVGFAVASVLLSTSCSVPGRQVDESGLGERTPLQREIARLYAGGGGTRLINEWFNETCPQTDLEAIVQCASVSGFNCDNQIDPDSDKALCTYEGTARVR